MEKINRNRFYIAEQYIQASKNLIQGMLDKNNPQFIISDEDITDDDFEKYLKYSSQKIILPALFCLYQGIELILKGFVNMVQNNKGSHDAEKLCKEFSKYYVDETELQDLFNKFIFTPVTFIEEYKAENNIKKTKDLYNSLRYPDSNAEDSMPINHMQLKYPNDDIFLSQVKELMRDVEKMIRLSVILFHKSEEVNQ